MGFGSSAFREPSSPRRSSPGTNGAVGRGGGGAAVSSSSSTRRQATTASTSARAADTATGGGGGGARGLLAPPRGSAGPLRGGASGSGSGGGGGGGARAPLAHRGGSSGGGSGGGVGSGAWCYGGGIVTRNTSIFEIEAKSTKVEKMTRPSFISRRAESFELSFALLCKPWGQDITRCHSSDLRSEPTCRFLVGAGGA